ncbi:MAG: hypothetical protein O3B73_12845, partial [bacterium]|nr:hypothetical protein [bacterium]
MIESPSPFARPTPGLRIAEGAPIIERPNKEAVDAFPEDARHLLDRNQSAQRNERKRYAVDWAKGKHFVIVGGTGLGIGCSVATAVMDLVEE